MVHRVSWRGCGWLAAVVVGLFVTLTILLAVNPQRIFGPPVTRTHEVVLRVRQLGRVATWQRARDADPQLVSAEVGDCPLSQAARESGIPTTLTWYPTGQPSKSFIYTGVTVPALTSFVSMGLRLGPLQLFTLGVDGAPTTLYLIKDYDPATAYVFRSPAAFPGQALSSCVF